MRWKTDAEYDTEEEGGDGGKKGGEGGGSTGCLASLFAPRRMFFATVSCGGLLGLSGP